MFPLFPFVFLSIPSLFISFWRIFILADINFLVWFAGCMYNKLAGGIDISPWCYHPLFFLLLFFSPFFLLLKKGRAVLGWRCGKN